MTREQIHQLIALIDLTTLDSKDNEASVLTLVKKANLGIAGIKPAAICCYPQFSDLVKNNTDIRIAHVGGYFPSGQTLSSIKLKEMEILADTHAEEIDIVVNRGEIIAGNYQLVGHEIRQAKDAIKGKVLKVILESGDLSPEQISKSSRIALEEGTDFLKTSTGKSAVGATPEAAILICKEIKLWHEQTGKKVGFKASGGIRTFTDAMVYYNIVKSELGQEWLNPELFRIGASSLYDHLAEQLEKL